MGSHLVRSLLSLGCEVSFLSRSDYPHVAALGAQAFRGCVTDRDAVQKAVAGHDCVFHTASRVGYHGARKSYFRTNVVGTRCLLDASVSAGVRRFIYTSTPSVAVDPDHGVSGGDESLPYPKKFRFAYGETKALAEQEVLARNSPSLQTISLRPHLIFGPGDPWIAPKIVAAAQAGRLVQVGDGKNKVDVTYIDNAVHAHILAEKALRQPNSLAAGRAYFIGQEKPVELWAFFARILQEFDAPPVEKRLGLGTARVLGRFLDGAYRILPLPGEPRLTTMAATMLGKDHYFSHEAARRDLGYVPAVSLEDALDRTFARSETT